MTTVEIIKRAKSEIEQGIKGCSDYVAFRMGKASALLEIAEGMAAADAEALKDALTLADLAKTEEFILPGTIAEGDIKAALEGMQGAPIQIVPGGVEK